MHATQNREHVHMFTVQFTLDKWYACTYVRMYEYRGDDDGDG